MYKKFFSAILFGVLTIASTSTFVSCKDYDDDINNLQAQIDELNNKKIAEINSTITELKNADAALQKAITDGDAATLAAAKTLIAEAIADCQKACKENLTKSQAEQDAKYDEAIAKVNQRVDDVIKLLSDQDGNIQQVGKDLKSLSDKLANFESQYGNLTTAFTDLTKRVTNLEDAYKAQRAALDDLAAKLSGQPGSNGYDDTALKNDIAGAKTRIDKIEQSVKDLETKLTKLITDGLKDVNDKIDKLDGKVENLRAAHEAFAETVTNEINSLKDGVASVKSLAESTAADLGKLDVMFKILVNDLRSLVFMPKLYIDGIETIEYPYLKYALLYPTDNRMIYRWENDEIQKIALRGEIYDFNRDGHNDSTFYAPVWPIQYHMNPGNASTEFDNIKGYYAYEAEVLTRAFYDTKNNAAGTWGIVPSDRWDNWYNRADMIWNKTNGIMTIGLQIQKPEGIDNPGVLAGTNHFPTDLHENSRDNQSPESVKNVIIALQANSSKPTADYAGAGKDTVITSDYAQVVLEKIKIEGLIWNKHPGYWDDNNERIVDFWQNKKGYGPATPLAPTVHPTPGLPNTYGQKNPAGWDYGYRKGLQNTTMGRDTICPIDRKWIHVWDNPWDALNHPADIELYISDRSGIKLSQYLGVHYFFEQNEPLTENVVSHKPVQKWAYGDKEMERMGFVWVFDTLDYLVDKNQTHDSRYCRINHKDGTIVAENVRESGATYEDETHTSVGREPLVRVRLYHFSNISDMTKWQKIDEAGGIAAFNALNAKPILDGYIRVHITKPELLTIDLAKNSHEFDLCNGFTQTMNTWARFNDVVLKKALMGMEKEQFDALYLPEYDTTPNALDESTLVRELVQYDSIANFTNWTDENKFYGFRNLSTKLPNPYPVINSELTSTVGGKKVPNAVKLGRIYITYDEVGTTNHTYKWKFTPEELEALTHDWPDTQKDITIVRYVHYTGHFYSSTIPYNGGARYDDLFIKLTLTITRANVPESKTSKRDENYWYQQDGSWNRFLAPLDAGLTDAERLRSIANNAPYPKDGLGNGDGFDATRTVPWRNDILRTWDTNKVAVTNSGKGSKFYFAPIEYEITVKTLDGNETFVVTPRRGSGDNIYNKFICKYITGNTHTFVYDKSNNAAKWYNDVELQKNNDILNKCAIRYQPDVAGIQAAYNMTVATVADPSAWPKCDGVFSNDTLYAIEKSKYNTAQEYEPIAIITNTSTGAGGGQVTLLHEYVENKWLSAHVQPSSYSTCREVASWQKLENYPATTNKYLQANEWDKENAYTTACLNAVGYVLNSVGRYPDTDTHFGGMLNGEFDDKGNPLSQQLRSYVGVIATSLDCNIANRMNDTRTNMFAIFQMTWERPINLLDQADFMVDAINNGDYIYMVDILKLFDWRGASKTPHMNSEGTMDTGYMWGDDGIPSYWTVQDWRKNQWLWSYYNVKAITVELSPNKIYTNLSETDPAIIKDPSRWKTMDKISNGVELRAKGLKSRVTFKYPDFGATMYTVRGEPYFPLRTTPHNYNAVSENQKLIEYMGLKNPRVETFDGAKGQFGYIFYENNGQNVYDFDVIIPISVTYDWGEIVDEPIRIHIHFTRGN